MHTVSSVPKWLLMGNAISYSSVVSSPVCRGGSAPRPFAYKTTNYADTYYKSEKILHFAINRSFLLDTLFRVM